MKVFIPHIGACVTFPAPESGAETDQQKKQDCHHSFSEVAALPCHFSIRCEACRLTIKKEFVSCTAWISTACNRSVESSKWKIFFFHTVFSDVIRSCAWDWNLSRRFASPQSRIRCVLRFLSCSARLKTVNIFGRHEYILIWIIFHRTLRCE